MNGTKKRVLAAAALLGILFLQTAQAAKVSYVEKTGDTAYHLAHLLAHEEDTLCTCTADEVKVRVAPGSKDMHGRMMTGDQFVIIDHYKDWLRVKVVSVHGGHGEIRRNTTGWVNPEYIDCGCDEAAYYAAPAQAE